MASSFAFGFLDNSNINSKESPLSSSVESPQELTLRHEAQEQQQSSPTRLPLQWLPNVSTALEATKERQTEWEYRELALPTTTTMFPSLKYVVCHQNNDDKASLEVDCDDNNNSLMQMIRPSVYEGGSQLWECSKDLVRYLANNYTEYEDCERILELGCGHALPAIFMMKQHEQSRHMDVTLTDYNKHVILNVTLVNLIMNEIDCKNVRISHGDWLGLDGDGDCVSQQSSLLFDLVLAAETVYTVQAAQETATVVARQLSREGRALIATKRFYFGVGGGVDEFSKAAVAVGLAVEAVMEMDDGNGNIRDILRVAWAELS